MSMGDTYYKWIASGSTATTASGITGLFGAYSGLSLINANEVVIVQVVASGGDLRVSADPATGATNNRSLFVGQAASLVDMPAMVRSDASQMTFCREIASEVSNNPVAQWIIWRRVA